jgi:hypothetical protein
MDGLFSAQASWRTVAVMLARLPDDEARREAVAVLRTSLVNAGRAFVAIGIVELFWIVTEWPNGALAITFTAIGFYC